MDTNKTVLTDEEIRDLILAHRFDTDMARAIERAVLAKLPGMPAEEWLTKADELFNAALNQYWDKDTIEAMRVHLRARIQPAASEAGAVPIATLHDDGHYTFHGTKPEGYDRAGWRMDVIAASPSAPAAEPVPDVLAEMGLNQHSPAAESAEPVRTNWHTKDGRTCVNCGKGIGSHERQVFCPTAATADAQGLSVHADGSTTSGIHSPFHDADYSADVQGERTPLLPDEFLHCPPTVKSADAQGDEREAFERVHGPGTWDEPDFLPERRSWEARAALANQRGGNGGAADDAELLDWLEQRATSHGRDGGYSGYLSLPHIEQWSDYKPTFRHKTLRDSIRAALAAAKPNSGTGFSVEGTGRQWHGSSDKVAAAKPEGGTA